MLESRLLKIIKDDYDSLNCINLTYMEATINLHHVIAEFASPDLLLECNEFIELVHDNVLLSRGGFDEESSIAFLTQWSNDIFNMTIKCLDSKNPQFLSLISKFIDTESLLKILPEVCTE